MNGRGTSTRRRVRRLDKAERRAKLLQCAIRVFARRGIGAARHAEIARKAGVTVPAVFYYFPTRKALVNAVLEEVARFFLEMTETVHAQRRPAPEIFLEHMRTFADAVDTHPDYTRVMLEWSTALRDEVWPQYLRFQEQNIAITSRTIRRWRMETGSDRDLEGVDEALAIASTGFVLVQMKVAKLPNSRIEHFMQTLLRDTLGEDHASPAESDQMAKLKLAVG
jgi:TetR/AcrR family hemagglutinin/protease transcriptional regulator